MADVVIVTPNPALDVTYHVPVNRPGETNRVAEVHHRPGGKGLNVAQVLDTLNVSTVSVLPLGGRNGVVLTEQLESFSGGVHPVIIRGQTRSTVTVADQVGHPTVYNETGPDLGADEWLALRAAIRAELSDARVLVIAGSLPGAAPHGELCAWIGDARQAGVEVVVDCSGRWMIEAAKAGADVLKANADEIRDATNADTVEDGVQVLLRRGAGCVVASLGSEGIFAYEGGHAYHVTAIPGLRGNPTGAGDAATAGLVAARLQGAPPITALAWASAAGAAAVLRPVAGEVDLVDFSRFSSQLLAERATS
ncbi:1-phosphofructokinase family hexose kinase [Subtercola lobariae]|uniref:Sugar kinase n=1 Tax=Subtercola lobariae TaxID=1588641 RepID=A0A917B017_9MICO|nr:hexose kinase [Subtercola lobariae]GGF10452.1 sugar kinase [Subtercola lobariae]